MKQVTIPLRASERHACANASGARLRYDADPGPGVGGSLRPDQQPGGGGSVGLRLAQLAEIYRAGGRLSRWSDLGVRIPAGRNRIVVVNRQSSSGTYEFFCEHVLANRDFALGSLDMNDSKEVVDLIASTPGAIGYGGMAFATQVVKMLRVRRQAGDPAFAPTLTNVLGHHYPISRSVLIYTLGEPRAMVGEYNDWLQSPTGQRIVPDSGYVPVCSGKDLAPPCGVGTN